MQTLLTDHINIPTSPAPSSRLSFPFFLLTNTTHTQTHAHTQTFNLISNSAQAISSYKKNNKNNNKNNNNNNKRDAFQISKTKESPSPVVVDRRPTRTDSWEPACSPTWPSQEHQLCVLPHPIRVPERANTAVRPEVTPSSAAAGGCSRRKALGTALVLVWPGGSSSGCLAGCLMGVRA